MGSVFYLVHFVSTQPLEFTDLGVTLAPDRKSFESDFATTLTGPFIEGEPPWTATASDNFTPAPEPSTMALLAIGLSGFGHERKHRVC